MQITLAASRPSPRQLDNFDILFAWLSSFILIGLLILLVMLFLYAIQVPQKPQTTVYCFGGPSAGCSEPAVEMNNEDEDQGISVGPPVLGILDQLLQQLPPTM